MAMVSDRELLAKGMAELHGGNIAAAERTCAQLLAMRPKDAEAINLRALIAHQRGQLPEAVKLYQSAIALRPDAAGFHNNLGVSLTAMGRVNEAAESYRKAASLNPNSAQIRFNFGTALQSLGQHNEALQELRAAVSLRPEHAEAHNSLGISLYMTGDLEGAIAGFEKAANLRPDFASAWSNLANVLRDAGRLDEALAAYRRAIAIQPDHPDAHKNMAILLLLRGDYANGFWEYEWRWRCDGAQLRRFDRPRWTGEDPAGKTVFLYEEQGYGDVIQFARYAKVLADRGAQVILGCRPELGRLMACCAGVAQVITAGQSLPTFDLHCPLLSLPLFCGTTMPADVPADVPYIRMSREIARPWRERVGPGAALRVGLCWAGNPQNRNDCYRSIPLEKFARLAAIGNIEFHSLQVGPSAADRTRVPELNLRDHGPELKDFAETAALIEQLDLVISVDTSIAHLTGALGKPVWVLLPTAPDWRWLLDRTDSPWYPTARLFRVIENWDQVLTEVGMELGEWAQAFRRPSPV
jgi:Flp pilus assembly protein TadD